jgi:hypothetical protein
MCIRDRYADVFAALWQLPRFRRAWTAVEREPPPAGAARALVPARLAVPGAGALVFRLTAERFTRDSRFRLIYFFPADGAAIAWCAAQPAGGQQPDTAITGKPGARSS